MRWFLTHPQTRIWHIEKIYPNIPINNLVGVSQYSSLVNFSLLEQSFNSFIRRNDIIRSRYLDENDITASLEISDYKYVNVAIVDFSKANSPFEEYDLWLSTESKIPFDIYKDQLFRIKFFKINDSICGYFVNIHHLIADGWSMQILANHISNAYLNLTKGKSDNLTGNENSYKEYIDYEINYLKSANFFKNKEYWNNKFSTKSNFIQLGIDTNSKQIKYTIDAQLSEKMTAYSALNNISISSLFTAFLFIYLSRKNKSYNLTVGMALANRLGANKQIFGMFTSIMPLSLRVSDHNSLIEFLSYVRKEIRTNFIHQQYPYDLLIQDLSLRQFALFDICINYYNTKVKNAATIGNDEAEIKEIFVEHQLFPLYIIIKEWSFSGEIDIDFNFKINYLDEEQIADIFNSFLKIFEQFYNNTAETIGDLEIVKSAKDQKKVTNAQKNEYIFIDNLTSQNKEHAVIDDNQFPYTKPDFFEKENELKTIDFKINNLFFDQINDYCDNKKIPIKTLFSSTFFIILSKYCCNKKLQINEWSSQGDKNIKLLKLIYEVKINQSFEELLRCIDDNMATCLEKIISWDELTIFRDSTSANLNKSIDVAISFEEISGNLSSQNINILLTFLKRGSEIEGKFIYNFLYYDEVYIQAIINQFLYVLHTIIKTSHLQLSEIDILTTEDKHQLLVKFNETDTEFDRTTNVINLFEKIASQKSEELAIIGNNFQYSYDYLNKKANQLARLLINNAEIKNKIVPIIIERCPEMLIAIYAVLKAGGAYLPVDPSLPYARIEFIIKDSGSSMVIVKNNLPAEIYALPLLFVDISNTNNITADDTNLSTIIDPEQLAYVIYTSGSTGTPKGVMIKHSSLVNRLNWMQKKYPIAKEDVILQKTSITFDVSVWELFWWATTGAKVCLLNPGDEKNPDKIVEIISQFKVTIIHFVPSMLSAFIHYATDTMEVRNLSSLRYVFASGEALKPYQVNSFNKILKAVNNTELINLYGPTEATIDVSYFDCTDKTEYKNIPIGKPIDNIKLYILGEKLELLPVGVAGELCISGIGLSVGYINRENLTKEKFIDHPFSPSEKLYKTGDRARWLPDGNIEFIGRIDYQVKIRGQRVELGEVESILRNYKEIKDAEVIFDDNKQQLIAFIITQNSTCTAEEIKSYAYGFLPEHMVPLKYIFVNSFPLNSNGKIDKKLLSLTFDAKEEKKTILPQTQLQKKLYEIWQQILGINDISIYDNFFSLGGDSIKFISILSKAKSAGINFTFQQLFKYPTISGLAEVINTTPIESVSDYIPFSLISNQDKLNLPSSAEDAYPLAVLQKGLIYQSEISKGTALYHDVFSYRIKGKFIKEKFEQALVELANRHDIVRTTYHLKGFSEYIQIVHKKIPIPLKIIDLRSLSSSEQKIKIEKDTAGIKEKNFDWEEPGMIFFHIHILNNEEYLYTVNFHDSALDGWSVNFLHTELFQIYYRLVENESISKPEKKIKYSHFVYLEQKSINSNTDKVYWKKRLENSVYTKMPIWPNFQKDSDIRKVHYKEVSISKELSNALKKTANILSVPVKTVLLAAHVKALSILTSNNDILTGYEYSGRPEEIDAEEVLGLFLNTLPFRILMPQATWAAFVSLVYKTELDFIPHRRYPMANIKQDIKQQNFLFETVFNFTHFHILKRLEEIREFSLLNSKLEAQTEFIFRVEFSLHPFTDDVLLWFHYHSNVFPDEQVEFIGKYYLRILELISSKTNEEIDNNFIISDTEKTLQIKTFNQKIIQYPDQFCFHQLFEVQVEKMPDAIAISMNGTTWTYEMLNKTANKIAAGIRKRGIKLEDIVTVILDRDIYWVAAIIGILKAGGVYLPLEPSYPIERILTVLKQSKTKAIIENDNAVAALIEKNKDANYDICTINELIVENNPEINLNLKIKPENLAYIIFTSGSTGLPKGAMIEHKGMLNHLYAKVDDFKICEKDVIAQTASQCFDISIWQLFSGLLVGATIIIYPNDLILKIPEFIDHVKQDKVTILEVVPSYLDFVLKFINTGFISFDDIKYLVVTGEQLNVSLVNKWFSFYPGIPLVNAYGPTEASDDITHHIINGPIEGETVPVGMPIQNMSIYVLDSDMKTVPIGTAGEVCVSGVGVGRGYINDPEKTSLVFVKDPFRDDSDVNMYRTGDIGRWLPDGILELYGRRDEQIKINGFRIEIGEIENQIRKGKGIHAVSVIIDEKNDRARIVAVIVSDEGLDISDLRRSLLLKLPYYMMPAHFIITGALPLTQNGKVAKKELIKMVSELNYDELIFIPPQKKNEIYLSELWAEVLKVDNATISIKSNFFDLGGHSLKAMELTVKANGAFNINDVFRYPVLEDLASIIDKKSITTSKHELLISYSEDVFNKEISLIGFTYAGGNAINFMPLFNSIYQMNGKIACYAIELPGHSYDSLSLCKSIAETAQMCLAEIKKNINTPIILWGHCSGSALALEVARLLEKSNIELKKVFIGGKIINSKFLIKCRSVVIDMLANFLPVKVDTMTNEQIKRWMINKTSFKDFESIGGKETLAILETFRHDTSQANNYFISAANEKIKAPIINVIASDDLLTKKYKNKFHNWNIFSDKIILKEISGGGHYFIKTKPHETAKIILESL